MEYEEILNVVCGVEKDLKNVHFNKRMEERTKRLFESCADPNYYSLEFKNHWGLKFMDLWNKRMSPWFIDSIFKKVKYSQDNQKILISIDFEYNKMNYISMISLSKKTGSISLIPENDELKKNISFVYFDICCDIMKYEKIEALKTYWENFPVDLFK